MSRIRILLLAAVALGASAVAAFALAGIRSDQGWTAELETVPTKLTNLSGVAFDGEKLWLTPDGTGKIYRVDPVTGKTEREITFPGLDAGGSAWDGRYLWQLAYNDRKIYKLNVETGKVEDVLPSPGKGRCSGVAFDGRYLWLANWEDERIYRIDPQRRGAVVSSLQSDFETTGLVWDGRHLWNGIMVGAEIEHDAAAPPTGFVQQRDVKTNEILRVFSIPGVGPGTSEWVPGGEQADRFWWYDHFHGKVVRLELEPEHGGLVPGTVLSLLALNLLTVGVFARASRRRDQPS
jgi:hypothetical protein